MFPLINIIFAFRILYNKSKKIQGVYMDKNNKFSKILKKKDCMINSLKEVNCFLYNINKALCLNKIIKKIK